MQTRIIIARHGNTFKAGKIPKRIGAKTDIPLVERHRAESMGKYLKDNRLIPTTVYAAPLLRTVETAELAVKTMEINLKILTLNDFSEIDYGQDENKTETEVFLRLGNGNPDKGKEIIEQWNKEAKVPDGWDVKPENIIKTWFDFAQNKALRYNRGRNTLIITSNGIIRFAPYLTGNFETFAQTHDIKVATGGICIFEKNETDEFWTCKEWNLKPYKIYTEQF